MKRLLAAESSARKKAPRKAHVPGGQRTRLPFRERLDAITLACGRTHGRSRWGGGLRLPRVGECIVADGRPPCQRQPLRGLSRPSRGADPSTWSVGLRGLYSVESKAAFPGREDPKKVRVKPHGDLPTAFTASSWGRQNTAGDQRGSRLIFWTEQFAVLAAVQVPLLTTVRGPLA